MAERPFLKPPAAPTAQAGERPVTLTLDASILDDIENVNAVRDDVQYNRISFEFPKGFSALPLLEECRALNGLDDFDLMYDITMQMLTEKPVLVYLKDYLGEKHLVAKFVVTDKNMNLRGVPLIDSFPIVVNWLAEFVAGYLRKKYPRPSKDDLRPMVEATAKQTEAETQTGLQV